MPLLPPSPSLSTSLLAAATSASPTITWILPRPLFKIVVLGSIIGLVIATLVILAIWVVELRRGKVW